MALAAVDTARLRPAVAVGPVGQVAADWTRPARARGVREPGLPPKLRSPQGTYFGSVQSHRAGQVHHLPIFNCDAEWEMGIVGARKSSAVVINLNRQGLIGGVLKLTSLGHVRIGILFFTSAGDVPDLAGLGSGPVPCQMARGKLFSRVPS